MINENTGFREQKELTRDGYQIEAFSSKAGKTAHTWVARSLNDIDRLAQVWDSLGSTVDSPMQHFIWSRACVETFGSAGKLNAIAVEAGDHLTAIAPLIKRRGVISRLESIGVKELYEPMDFLYADQASLKALADNLAKQGTAVWLRRIPADSPVIGALRETYKGRGWVHTKPVDPYPYIELSPDWIEPEKQFNSGRRSDFRRAQRHAGQIGEVKYEMLSPAPSEVGDLLEEAYRVEMASWKGAEGSALAVDPVRGAFYRKYAVAASERGILRLCFLRINGQAVGMQFAIECGDRFWLLKIGHDDKFAKCSPGTLLMLYSVKYAAERGLRSYEFLGTAESWTRNWTELLHPCVALRAYPMSIGGVAATTLDAARLMLSKLKRKVRDGS
jgi:CelD/BcsL family acetyltransferase involved in cellulose biosynthesis